MAKAARWGYSDANVRKRGERTGLDTPVVHAVNDEYRLFGTSTLQVAQLTRCIPPGEYGRKTKTQRN